jgi:2-polyprenyl-3-methyl-5-hydroxy-6-metoxy-1,4-benzoquinol methylase
MNLELATASVPCALCGSAQTSPLAVNEGLHVVRCAACSLVFVNPQPTEAAIESYYSAKDLAAQESWSSYFQHTPAQIADLWNERFAGVARWTNGRAPRLLDIGCGWGDFLHVARCGGWPVSGFEFSESVAQVAREKYGLSVRVGSLEDMGYPPRSFDLITMWHVLEHLREPRAALVHIETLLSPGGLLVLEVPNLNFLPRKSYRYPMSRTLHLYHFSPATLAALVERAGFRVLACCPGHTGHLYPSRAKVLAKKSLNALTRVAHRLFGVNFGDSIRLYARSKESAA